MGFIKAFVGALGGTFANQWLDYLAPNKNVADTVAIYHATLQGQNNGRGENYKGNHNIISNGSKILVPEGTALITLQDGQITGFIAEPGGYIFQSDDINSQSIFAGNGIVSSLIKSSWDKFKFGGSVGAKQQAIYVNLKEIPNNKFGTQSEIYYDDAYLGTQVGALTRGTYTIKIVDPILFIKQFVPIKYLNNSELVFDFADLDNDACNQLFNETVSSLSAAFSMYTNDPARNNRITKIQSDSIGFGAALSQAVENNYKWKSQRGLEIVQTAIIAIEYDQDTKELIKDVKKADALAGNRGNSFMQQSVARGIQSAGENGGGSNMAFMGVGVNAAGGMMNNYQQPNTTSSYQATFNQPANNTDPTTKLIEMKKLLDAGVISQEEFDKLKAQILGL